MDFRAVSYSRCDECDDVELVVFVFKYPYLERSRKGWGNMNLLINSVSGHNILRHIVHRPLCGCVIRVTKEVEIFARVGWDEVTCDSLMVGNN